MPIAPSDGSAGALELSESLVPEKSSLRAVAGREAVTSLLVLAFAAVVVVALGYTFIGRPMRQLAEQARRMASLRRVVERNDVHAWARSFLEGLAA